MNDLECDNEITISVIIVSYNVKYYVEQCLLSLNRALQGIRSEIFVVDNNSKDGTVEYLSERFQEISIISSNHNVGFARANNLAIKQSKGTYILLLNPDTIVGEDTIRNVIRFMNDHPNAGGTGVRMMSDTGNDAKESRRGTPTPLTSFYKMIGLCSRYPNSNRFAKYYMGGLSWDEPAKIEIVSGAFFAVSRSAIHKVGLLDEDYFMYGEDIDWSYRLLKHGFDNWYIPTRILHYKGESTQKSSFRYVHVFYKAMLIFFHKHYNNMSLLLSIPIKVAIYAKAAIALINLKVGHLKKSLGMLPKDSHQIIKYIFIGSSDSIVECKELFKQKGLEADFYEKNDTNLLNGHNELLIDTNQPTCVIYDIGLFSFKEIFNFFYQNPKHHITMGTYHPETKMIITAKDVFKQI